MRQKYEVADVISQFYDDDFRKSIPLHQQRTLSALLQCRTASLGGHIDACDACGFLKISYNSCRNRNCPKCQGMEKEMWIIQREEELLPVPYFHVVFTLPDHLNRVALSHPKKVYKILFDTTWQTLLTFGNNPKHLGARLGMIAVLHTWGQNLQLHPHLHCIVPKGGVSKAGYWKKGNSKDDFLFCVKALSKKFRGAFVAKLRKEIPGLPQELYDKLFYKKWVFQWIHKMSMPLDSKNGCATGCIKMGMALDS